MLLNILKQINWVDILVLILVVRTCFIAAKCGFPIELFKFLGTLSAIYFSFHYFVILSDYISDWLALGKRLPLEFLQFIIFVLLAIAGYAAFILLRSILYRFLKMEAVSSLNKWGGLILGIARGTFLASLIIFAMFISSIDYLRNSSKSSYSGKRLFMLAPDTYVWLWNSVVSKFAASEKLNDTIILIDKEFLNQ
ncbi:MAG: CvpA family protein [Candidatus Omnitrophota bacterium]|nr:CvpA family protein [Candidatus Omnitrophota bacterium]